MSSSIYLWDNFSRGISGFAVLPKTIGALSVYAAVGLEPPLVLDFIENYYRTGGSASTFDDALNFSRAGNATMVDSDGVLKWAPHNILARSQDFETLWTTTGSTTVTGDFAVAPDGTMTAARVLKGFGASGVLQQTLTVGDNQTKAIWARTPSGSGTVALLSFNGQTPSPLVTVTEEWQLFELASDTAEPGGENFYAVDFRGGTLTEVYIWGAHLYRSDLGGMADNPATGNSYVPTTDSARYLPRVGNHVYNGTEWVNEGLLLESEARTNFNANSNTFTVSGNVTKTEGAATAPDGTTSAVLVEDNSANNGNAAFFDSANPSAGTDVTSSVFVKYVSGSGWVAVVHRSLSRFNQFFAWFNILTGEKGGNESGSGSLTYVDHDIENVGDGWYRVYTVGNDSVRNNFNGFIASASSDGDKNRETGNDVYLWRHQLEESSKPSSLIPTNGSTVTRAAEILDVAAADMPWSSSAVSIQMDGAMTYTDNDLAIEVSFHTWRLTSTDFINARLSTQSSRTGQVTFYQREAISGQDIVGSINAAYAPGINVPFSIASRHGSTFINGAVDGTALTANTTPTALPDLSTTDFDIGPTFMGNIGKLRVWAEDLGDTGIEEAST